MTKIIDSFLFFNELDLLEIRLGILYDYVDFFSIFEFDRTFSGKEKPYYFSENKSRFLDPLNKIKSYTISRKHTDKWFWDEEYEQRNFLSSIDYTTYFSSDVEKKDVFLLMSDADEIPDPENFEKMIKGALNVFEHSFYYYKINNRVLNFPIGGSRSVTLDMLDEKKNAQYYRNLRDSGNIIRPGGWHFSYLGNEELMKEKIEAFSHNEFNTDEIKNNLSLRLKNNVDILGRDNISFAIEDAIEENGFPSYILKNKEKLCQKKLLVC